MKKINEPNINDAAIVIKDAIVLSRYQAAKLVNRELLSLYYGVGKFVSDNSREGYWGQSAIKQISDLLQKELPGLRGFSEAAIKKMRIFYEDWHHVFSNRSFTMNDLRTDDDNKNRSLSVNDLSNLENIKDFISAKLKTF